jgi:hypothetical protein
MKKLAIFALSLLAIPAMADNSRGFYAGLGGSRIQIPEDGGILETSPFRGAEILAGYKYNGLLGIEVRYGAGISKGTKTLRDAVTQKNAVLLTHEVDNYSSVYYRPELINDEAKLYLLLGYTKIDVSTGVGAAKPVPVSYSGLSYGLGVSFVTADNYNFTVEYKNICEELSSRPTVYSVGFDYRF